MDERLQQLRDRRAALRGDVERTLTAADDQKRDLTTDELASIEGLERQSEQVEQEIAAREKHLARQTELDKPRGRQTDPGDLSGNNPGRQNPNPRVPAEVKDGRGGFRTFGELALSVRAACMDGGVMDRRLEQLAPSTFATEASGSDGGFAIPPDFRTDIVTKVMGPDSLLARTDQYQCSGNSFTAPVDELEPWSTSGIRAYWEGEGKQHTASKPVFNDQTTKLNKLAALVVVSDEMLEDATSLDSYLRKKTPQVMNHKINEAVLFGTGAGMPLGAVNGAAKVRVAEESAQTADTVVYANVSKMWNRMYAPARQNAIWLCNQDVEPELEKLYLPTGSNSGALVYMPPGGISGAPYGTIRNRPVIPIENAKQLGDEGDLILWDPSTYLTVTKKGNTGVRTDMSIHLYFDYDLTAFRFIFRLGGQNWFTKPVTPANGSNTRSNVVTLADRA